jgi:hypothetical protein
MRPQRRHKAATTSTSLAERSVFSPRRPECHEYEGVAAPVMWKLVQDDLTPLEQVCREELTTAQRGEDIAPSGDVN